MGDQMNGEDVAAANERPALEDPETQAVLRRRSHREWRFVAQHLGTVAVIGTGSALIGNRPLSLVALVVLVVYVGMLKSRYPGSSSGAKRVLREYPWRSYGYRLETHGMGRRGFRRIVLLDPKGRALGSFSGEDKYLVGPTGETQGDLLFAGHPVYGGIMRLPGSEDCGLFTRANVPQHTSTPEEESKARRARIFQRRSGS
ncbi:hypothetical protein [Streptomyces sp. SID3343]|uniref:hypothetical protein n=1 Tax=Streptomyces sp. SID3343 TaxID=2690260 RepID=UPI001370BA85|nr:hypothetical protein [Streptomyces sp. SID3343]MYV99495.1 hypothetical protein [Streptomyces sp. SID3343]